MREKGHGCKKAEASQVSSENQIIQKVGEGQVMGCVWAGRDMLHRIYSQSNNQ